MAVEPAVDREVGQAARAQVRLAYEGGGVPSKLHLLRQERVAQVDAARRLDVVT